MVTNPNSPTQKELAKKFNLTRQGIGYQINKKIKKKRVIKPKAHFLSEKMIEKRYKRSWKMYNLLKDEKWKKFITSDESMFHLSNNPGKTKWQYIDKDLNRSVCEPYEGESHPKGVMVWIGISYNGITRPRFVKPGAKVNAKCYISKVLKPFLRDDVPVLYPNKDFIFHQDSAPSHKAKLTIKYLESQKVKFIYPEQWLANSPDAAPCDYFFWSYLKKKVYKHKVTTIGGLKKVIIDEAKKIPLELVRKALKLWPKRCRLIYYNKGKHIDEY